MTYSAGDSGHVAVHNAIDVAQASVIASAAASAAAAALAASLVGAPADVAVAAIVGDPASDTATLLSSIYVPNAKAQPGTVGSPTDATHWSFQPRDPAKGPYQSVMSGGMGGGSHWDTVLFWGYNTAGAQGAKALAGEPSYAQSIEQDWDDGTARWLEWHLEFFSADNTIQRRPISFQTNRSTGATTGGIQAGMFLFKDDAGASLLDFNIKLANGWASSKPFLIALPAGATDFPLTYMLDNVVLFAVQNNGSVAAKGSVTSSAGLITSDGASPAYAWRDAAQTTKYQLYMSSSASTDLYLRDVANGRMLAQFEGAPTTTDSYIWFHSRFVQGVPNSALADGTLGNSEASFYLDESGNNLKVKVKYAGGTVKIGTVALA